LDHNPFAQLGGPILHHPLIQVQFGGDRLVGPIQSHEIQTQHPDPQRLMLSFEYRSRQVVKLPLTVSTFLALPMRLPIGEPAFLDFPRSALRTLDPFRPAHLPHHRIAFRIIYPLLDIQQHLSLLPFILPLFQILDSPIEPRPNII
jgi:hypothetical protein